MAEEAEVKIETGVVESNESEEHQYSDIEKEAMSLGWNPDGVEGKRNLSPEEFIDRQGLYDKIHSRDKRLKHLESQINKLAEESFKLEKRGYDNAIRELKDKQKEALDNANHDQFLSINDEIQDLQREKRGLEESRKINDIESILQSFVESNPWYNSDPELKKYFDRVTIGEQNLRIQNGDSNPDPEDILEVGLKEIKARFPEKFGRRPKEKAPMVEGGNHRTSSNRQSKTKTARDLPEEARTIGAQLVRLDAFESLDDYAKAYFERQERKK